MKSFLSLLIGIFICSFGMAQGTQTGTVKYNGATYPADVVEYNLPPSDALSVIRNKMSDMGYNAAKSGKNGPLVYRNVVNADINNGNPVDMIFDVSSKGKKQKGVSTVSVVTAAPGEIPDGKVKGMKGVMAVSSAPAMGMFLSSFQGEVASKSHDLAISAKAGEISKSEKDLAKLQKEQSKLESRIQKLQSDLEKNTADQQSKVNEINSLKNELSTLKTNAPGL